MPGIDDILLFRPLNFAVLTISDKGPTQENESGDSLVDRIANAGHAISERRLIKSDTTKIAAQVKAWAMLERIDVILTLGGVGMTENDEVVDVLKSLFDKTLTGFPILFHDLQSGLEAFASLQWRVCAGLVDGTFVFCLPSDIAAAEKAWDEILSGALDSRYRPSSLVDLIPRLKE